MSDCINCEELVPATEVAEIIRCKNCKYSIMHKFSYNYGEVLACDNPIYVILKAVSPSHFCSYGKLKGR